MKSVAVVNGLEPFKGSTAVAKAYYEAFQQLGYETHWYQCGGPSALPREVSHGRLVEGISTGQRAIDQGLNFTFFFPRRMGRLPEELVLLTDPNLLAMTAVNPGSLVVVHDLREFHFRTRTNLAAPFLMLYLLSRIRWTRGILVDTEAIRADLLGRFRMLPPTAVVHPPARVAGASSEHVRRSLARLTEQRVQQILYIAVDRPYKHLRFVIDLARHIDSWSRDPEVRILIVSRLRPATLRYLQRNPAKCLRIISEVEDIATAYEESDVLLFPSEYEGFGLPIVEAMRFGLPIVTGQDATIREVVGSAGISVPGYGVAAWSEALRSLHDPATYARWASESIVRSGKFSKDAFRRRLSEVLSEWGL